MRIKDIGEIGLIDRLARQIRLDRSVIKGIGDDAAVIKWTRDKYLLFTSDMMIEDVHFRRDKVAPFEIGWKALGRNISDIAAMGGAAKYALVSIGLDPLMNVSVADGIYRGMASLAKRFGVNIVGGDTTRSGHIVIDVSLIGEVERDRLTLRNGARKGDLIFVTGSLGGSIKGKHLNFIPRQEEALILTERFKINSMIDISDGLLLDLWRVLDASKTGAWIYENLIPISKDARSFDEAVSAGEDFELLFTMAIPEAKRFFRTALAKMRTPVTFVGEVMDKKYGYRLIAEDGKTKNLTAKGYLHF